MSCIRRKASPDIRIRIPAIVIRIPIPRAAIRGIRPIAARKKLLRMILQPKISRRVTRRRLLVFMQLTLAPTQSEPRESNTDTSDR
jgi:hypothetical protein